VKITINKAMIDYVTMTTKSEAVANVWFSLASAAYGIQEDKIKRYEGYRGKGEGEGLFVGKSVGRAKPHYILQASGSVAENCLFFASGEMVKNGEIRVTRIDVQVTIQEPMGWSQIGYCSACEERGLKPEVKRSQNPIDQRKELMTVYTGTRTSGRYNRCYQKVMESGEVLLRYETEFSRGYSKSIAYGILSGKTTREEVVRGEIARRKVQGLGVFDLWQCGVFSPREERREVLDKRGAWLLVDVLPVFAEYINRHGVPDGVARAYLQVIENREAQNG
jgi:hypothetical protein